MTALATRGEIDTNLARDARRNSTSETGRDIETRLTSDLTDDEVRHELTLWAGRIAAGEAQFVDLVGELDARDAWAGVGILSAVHWLSWQCGLGANAARERVRVARALRNLPRTREEFRSGRLSFSQVRAITRVATPDSEETLVECARHSTAMQLERLVTGMRRAIAASDATAAHEAYELRNFSYHYDDDGSLVLRGRLPAEQGAAVVAALEAVMIDLRDDPPPGTVPELGVTAVTPTVGALRADALIAMAERSLAARRPEGGDPDTYRVVVHVDEATLHDDGAGGTCQVADGPAVPIETVRRLLCDTAVRAVTELRDGTLLDLGRSMRFPNRGLRRAVEARDRQCQFPACTRSKNLHAHHLKAWSRGGLTDLDNLVLLCSHHHHLVHEGGFTLTGRPGHLLVHTPLGNPVEFSVHRHPTLPAVLASTPTLASVDADTIRPDWGGEPMDVDWIVGGIMHAAEAELSAGTLLQ